MRRYLRAVISILAIATLAGFPPAAIAANREAWLPEIADSASLTGSPVIEGRISTKGGSAFAAGARVELLAWPSSEVVEATAVGQSVHSVPVAKGRVDADGRFSLRIGDVKALARYASKSGMVDFDIRSVSGDHIALYGFSKHLVSGDTASLVDPHGGAPTDARVTALGPTPAARNLGRDRSNTVSNKTDICGQTKVQTYAPVNVIVGATYLTTTGSTRFSYTSGASSSLGIGFSLTGTYGSWSLNGTSSKSSSSTVDFGARTSGSWIDKTQFGYAKWAYWCYPVYDTYDPSDIYAYEARVDVFQGGGTYVSTSAVSATNCAPLSPGVTWTVSTSTASGWSTGVNMAGPLGINLSSKTGYSSSAKLTYKNTGTVSHKVCGTTGPPSSPGLLLLKP